MTRNDHAVKAAVKRAQRHEMQMKFLCQSENVGHLSEADLDWLIKMEQAWKRQGYLTERQAQVVENLWGKC